MKKPCAILAVFVLVLLLCACGGYTETTVPATTAAHTTQAPTTVPATTAAPTTQAPATVPATTAAPTTQAPTTVPPTTAAPTTQAPTTQAPTTQAPTTVPATTAAPTTQAPTTMPPTTVHTHNWADATCDKAKTCTVCGATEGKSAGHAWKDATCDKPKTCTVCGATEGKAAGHAWKDATCNKPKTCTTCGTTEGEALGHSWVDATCTNPKTCTDCGLTEGEAKEHDWIAGTCAEPQRCAVCGATENVWEEHDYQNGVCTVCGAAAPTKTIYLLTSECLYDFYEETEMTSKYYYNENGYLTKIEETYVRTHQDYYNSYTKIITAHTAEGLPVRIEHQNGAWEFEYDSEGNVVKQSWSGDQSVVWCNKYECSYDETGFLLWESSTFRNGGTATSHFEKNEKGLITKETYIGTNGTVTTRLYSYTYDTSGRVVSKTITSDDEFTPVTSDKYYYDETGKLTKEEYLYDNRVMTTRWYYYDDVGNLTKVYSEYASEPRTADEVTYTYQAIEVPADSPLDHLDVSELD